MSNLELVNVLIDRLIEILIYSIYKKSLKMSSIQVIGYCSTQGLLSDVNNDDDNDDNDDDNYSIFRIVIIKCDYDCAYFLRSFSVVAFPDIQNDVELQPVFRSEDDVTAAAAQRVATPVEDHCKRISTISGIRGSNPDVTSCLDTDIPKYGIKVTEESKLEEVL